MATASLGRKISTGHMREPTALVVSFVLGRDFCVADIQALLWQALTRALCAKGGSLTTPDPVVGATQVLLRQALTRALRAYLRCSLSMTRRKTVQIEYVTAAQQAHTQLPLLCHERLQHQVSLVRHLLPWWSTSLRLLLALTTPMTTMTRTN